MIRERTRDTRRARSAGPPPRPPRPPRDGRPTRPDRRDPGGPGDRRPAGGVNPTFATIVGFLLVLMVPLVIAVGVRAAHGDEALPGTHVAGVDVGGLDATGIREAITPVLQRERVLTLVGPDDELETTAADAGYTVDIDATVQRALDAGRDGALAGLPSTLAGFVADHDVDPAIRVDGAAVAREVSRVADEIDREPFPGELLVDEENLTVELDAPRSGRTVDRETLAARLRTAVAGDGEDRISVPVDVRPVVPRETAERVRREAETYLETPLRLTGAGEPLIVEPEEIAGVLALEALEDRTDARLGAGDKRVAALAETLGERRDRPARTADISAPRLPDTVVDAKGDVSWRPRDADVTVSGEGRPGRRVDREGLATAIEEAIRAGEHSAEIPTERVEPDVTREAAESVTDVIGTFTSRYAPGQPRVTNIQRAAKAIDGTVVPPGGTFSLNGVTGERTKAKGYVPAPFIANNEIVDSVGGGVSQLSTTMYNAAYFAGLQIDAFQAHSLYIERYPPGRESTLNFPDIDMRWTNDTDAPILVRAATDDTSVTISLYGDNGDRKVRAEHGEREPVAGGDFRITVSRVITYADGRTERQPTTTRYDEPVESDDD